MRDKVGQSPIQDNHSPQALTQCSAPMLDWSRPDAPAADNFGDIYFSTDGGLEETRMVFLGGCGLPDGWQIQQRYTIGELGFGSGLNFLTTWQMWEDTAPKDGRLHFISIEKYPFDAAQLEKALGAWPELQAYSEQLVSQWPGRVKGFHRLHFGPVTLTLIHDDVAPALNHMSAKIDAWFLDGFSPSKNPDMWSADIMKHIAELSAPRAHLATFTVAGTVRTALSEAGFDVEKKTGFGRKRHRLEARLNKAARQTQTRAGKPIPTIIGSGIGGASLARAFKRRGIMPKIITRGNQFAASENAAALIKPRLDLQDRPESRFFLSSYLYALSAYEPSNGIISRGVTQIPKTEKEAQRLKKLAMQAPLSQQHLKFDNNILSLPQALMINPAAILKDWTSGCEIIEQEVASLKDVDGAVFAALGYGIKSVDHHISDTQPPELRYSRGQISWATSSAQVQSPLSYGGYALPLEDGLLIGATHDRITGNPYDLNAEDDARNRTQFETIMGFALEPLEPSMSRASVRVTTANTLPMIMNPTLNQYILTGLGSRGFVFAPLLAEAIVSHWLGEPLPMDKQVWAHFGPR